MQYVCWRLGQYWPQQQGEDLMLHSCCATAAAEIICCRFLRSLQVASILLEDADAADHGFQLGLPSLGLKLRARLGK